MYQYILFDLDGTLTDSKEGITKSAQYALRSFGIEEKNLDKLEPFIGPPLSDSFREFYGMNEADTEKAVRTFRERFETVGITENKIYPGVKEMLQELKDNGCLLAIASSKPEVSVHRVLQMFEIEQYFSIIVGSLKDGTRTTKIEVMEETFAQLKKRVGRAYSEKKVLMIGDRKFDIEGARHFGVDSVGVTYGYANDGELTKAGATYLAEDPQAVASLITGKKPYQKYADMSSLKKTLEILAPLAAYWLIQLAVYNILYYVLAKSGEVSAVCSAWLNVAAALAVCGQMLSEEPHTGLCRGCDKKEKETPYPGMGADRVLWDQSGTVFEFVYFSAAAGTKFCFLSESCRCTIWHFPSTGTSCIWTGDALHGGAFIPWCDLQPDQKVLPACPCHAAERTCIRLLSRKSGTDPIRIPDGTCHGTCV